VHSDARATRHAGRRDDLLVAAADYVLAHGLAGLSIRPLAAALGLSHRTLLYYFESKDKLIVAVLEVIRGRDERLLMEHLSAVRPGTASELFRASWTHFSAPERTSYLRFFHEVLALGLDDPTYRSWVERAIENRIQPVAKALARLGVPEPRTRAAAVLICAAVRGLQLHLLTTGDRAATDAAFEELLASFEASIQHSQRTKEVEVDVSIPVHAVPQWLVSPRLRP